MSTYPHTFYDNDGLPLDVQPQQQFQDQYQAQAWGQPQSQVPQMPPVPPLAGYPTVPQGPIQQKSAGVAALLCFFFGIFGVHNFYLGHTNRGIIMLVLTLFSFLSAFFIIGFVVLFAMFVWEFIDFIMILTRNGIFACDSRGVPVA